MSKIEKINEEIGRLEEELKTVQGTETEVYTRIVGYHRAINNWNKGKRREYDERVTFVTAGKKTSALKADLKGEVTIKKENEDRVFTVKPAADSDSIAYYNMFYSQFCHNCPPVKDFMNNVEIEGEDIDVSSDLGLNVARKYNVMSTPAVLLFDENKKLVKTAHSINELKEIFD